VPELQEMLEEFGLAESTRLLVIEGMKFSGLHCADGQWQCTPVIVTSDGSNLPLVSEPDDSCYVIYTSGSTGVPKFIEGWHKGLAHYCHWQATEFGLDEKSKISQMAPVTFEASLKDFFVSLCCGATLCIPSAEVKENPARLIEWIESSELTLFQTVPSYLRLVIREVAAQGNINRFPALKLVFQSGDTLYGKDVNQWRHAIGRHVELVNLYGPAEVTLLKSFHRIPPEELKPNEIVAIGKPISNTVILIMNNNTLCTPGKIGEICVKSPFIVKGYYCAPELTAEKFVQNPLNAETRDIIYRTGDLGRYRPDMTIEFVGRMDSQVKVHGNRIELAEIENVLLSFPKIGQSVVVPHRTDEMENILACYYTEQEPVSQTELRELILSRLPDYMLPAYFIRMEQLPLSLNGKVDRKALPKPEELVITSYEEPTTPNEKGLAEIWCEVLGLGRVGVGNKFIGIGGDSLKAIRVIARIYKLFGVEVSVREFFACPTIRELARFVDAGRQQSYQEIPAIPAADWYELSHAQRRLWLLDQMEKEHSVYNISGSFIITGPIDMDALQLAIGDMTVRHETLRTTFFIRDGEPQQKISPSPVSVFICQDFSDQPDPEGLAYNLFLTESSYRFDLETGPLFRITVAKLCGDGDSARYCFIFVIHHIISDVWSIGIMTAELSELYRARVTGTPPRLPQLRIQYRDFSAWQNERLRSGMMKQSGAYWHDKLSGQLPLLNLPSDFPRPTIKSWRGDTVSSFIDADTTAGIMRLASDRNASLFAVLTALIRVLVFRYTGEGDLVIGTPSAGRIHADLENQIGYFLNTLALRDSVSGGDTFPDLLEKVMKTNTDAFDNQEYPFDLLVGELDLVRDPGRNPVFDLMIVLHNTDDVPFKLHGTDVVEFRKFEAVSKFDLDFVFRMDNGTLRFEVEFTSALFLRERIERMCRHLEQLARSIVQDSSCRIELLDMLPAQERSLLIRDFNNRVCDYPADKSIVEVFSERVGMNPDADAIVSDGRTTSYRQLEERSRTLAGYLIQEHAAAEEEVIAVMMERSDLLIVSLLGIMTAGCAYLPIDGSQPEKRIARILSESRARIIITDGTYRQRVEQLGASSTVVDLSLFDFGQRAPLSAPLPVVRPDGLAYVIFTSGSTGDPNGVLIEHRSFLNFITDFIRIIGIDENDRMLQFFSQAFDGSLLEIFSALHSGAALVIAGREIIDNTNEFVTFLSSARISTAIIPPAYLNTVRHESGLKGFESFKTLIMGGEAAIPDDAMFYAGHMTCINAYGPTEASVCVCCHRVDPDRQYGRSIPLGTPLANTAILILDDNLEPVPIGITGEIFISGASVGRGYLNETLTQQKFVPNRFTPEERLYRTGDTGRWNSRGEVEYFGRRDNQLKIRGYRIESGEIEHAIASHHAVSNVVVCSDRIDNTNELTAYLVVSQELAETELREHLSSYLPHYMIPHGFVFLDELPLNTSGKVDKGVLSAMRHLRRDSDLVAIPPRNDLEKIIAAVWEGVLGRGPVGIHDNYFALGGDSIRAIQVVSRLHQQGFKVEVHDIFQFPTVAGLAGRVTKLERIADQGSVSGMIPLTPVQEWFFEQHRRGLQHFNQSILLGSRERLDEESLRTLLAALLSHHDALRIRFVLDGVGWQQENRVDVPPPRFEVVDLTGNPEPSAALERHTASLQAGFNLAAPPLLAAALYRLPDGDRLLIVIHHLVVDGVSWRILAEDLLAGYEQLVAGTPLTFPRKSDSFKLWSERLREYAAGDELMKEKEYWQTITQADAAPLPLLAVPEQDRGSAADFDEIQIGLSAEETTRMLTRANQTYHTDTADLLLTSLAHALHEWTGSRRHIITLEGHGREDIGADLDITRTVGWFTSLFPHLLELADRDEPGYRLRVVKEAIRAVPNHGLGYGVLRWLTPTDMKQELLLPPLPRISFNYLGTFDADFGSGPFIPSDDPHGDTVGPQIEASFDLECTCSVIGGRLSVNFRHDRRLIETGTVQRLADGLREHLQKLIAHCCQVEDAVITPSDISYDGLDIDQLDALLEGLGYEN
jgi:amino acid adenylation domain-containing protein/non-ribosomal peptide synthase protein (TIGR01720 family)